MENSPPESALVAPAIGVLLELQKLLRQALIDPVRFFNERIDPVLKARRKHDSFSSPATGISHCPAVKRIMDLVDRDILALCAGAKLSMSKDPIAVIFKKADLNEFLTGSIFFGVRPRRENARRGNSGAVLRELLKQELYRSRCGIVELEDYFWITPAPAAFISMVKALTGPWQRLRRMEADLSGFVSHSENERLLGGFHRYSNSFHNPGARGLSEMQMLALAGAGIDLWALKQIRDKLHNEFGVVFTYCAEFTAFYQLLPQAEDGPTAPQGQRPLDEVEMNWVVTDPIPNDSLDYLTLLTERPPIDNPAEALARVVSELLKLPLSDRTGKADLVLDYLTGRQAEEWIMSRSTSDLARLRDVLSNCQWRNATNRWLITKNSLIEMLSATLRIRVGVAGLEALPGVADPGGVKCFIEGYLDKNQRKLSVLEAMG